MPGKPSQNPLFFQWFLGDFSKLEIEPQMEICVKKHWMDFVCQVFSFSWGFSRRKSIFCQIELRSPFWAFWGLAAVGPFRFVGGDIWKAHFFWIKPTKEQTTKPGRVSILDHSKWKVSITWEVSGRCVFFCKTSGYPSQSYASKTDQKPSDEGGF